MKFVCNGNPGRLAQLLNIHYRFGGLGFEYRAAFLCNVPSTSRTLLFSDKAWVYKRHFVLDCNDYFMAQ